MENEIAIKITKNGKTIIHVPLWNFPEGAELRECFETETEIIVLGDPVDEDHNCDVMGCSTCFHVRYRFKK